MPGILADLDTEIALFAFKEEPEQDKPAVSLDYSKEADSVRQTFNYAGKLFSDSGFLFLVTCNCIAVTSDPM